MLKINTDKLIVVSFIGITLVTILSLIFEINLTFKVIIFLYSLFLVYQARSINLLIFLPLFLLSINNDFYFILAFSSLTLKLMAIKFSDSINSYLYDKRANLDLDRNLTYKVGDTVVSDGVISSGSAFVIENAISSNKFLLFKGESESILAGSKILKGEIDVVNNNIPTAINTIFMPKIKNVKFLYFEILFICLTLGFYSEPKISYIFGILLACSQIIEIIFNLKNNFSINTYMIGIYSKSPIINRIKSLTKICLDLDFINLNPASVIEEIEILDSKSTKDDIRKKILPLIALGNFDHALKEIDENTNYNLNISNIKVNENGVLGSSNNIKILLGTEDFLISNGVQLQQSDIVKQKKYQNIYYYSENNQILARIIIINDTIKTLQKLNLNLDKSCYLFTKNTHDIVSEYEFDSKIEIKSELQIATVSEKIAEIAPCIVYSNSIITDNLTFKDFDYVTKEIDAKSVYLLNRRISDLFRFFYLVQKYFINIQKTYIYLSLLVLAIFINIFFQNYFFIYYKLITIILFVSIVSTNSQVFNPVDCITNAISSFKKRS